MTDVEKKVDMSLDELVAMRQKEAKKKAKKPAKKTVRGAAKTASKKGKPTRKAVAQAASKMNRQQKMNARRGICLLYTSPSPRDLSTSRMPSSA